MPGCASRQIQASEVWRILAKQDVAKAKKTPSG
jgi:hypothetical protein